MLTSKDNPLEKRNSTENEQEQRIYQQLSKLDLKLKNKPFRRQITSMKNPWDSNQITQENDLNDFSNVKAQGVIPTYNPHMEYFSQISNQQCDEDSLFVYHNNFLGQLKYTYSDPTPSSHSIGIKNEETRNEVEQEQCSFGIKNHSMEFYLQNFSQMLKQRKYIYKKWIEKPSPSARGDLLQKVNKQSNEKKLSLIQKTRQKLKDQLNLQLQQNMKRRQSNCQYILKANQIEQQRKIQQSEMNNFETFEGFFTKGLEVNHHQKNTIRAKNYKEENSLLCTFKPSVLKKSSQIVKSTKNVAQRLSTHNQSKQKKQQKLQNSKPASNKQRIEELSQPRRLKTQGSQQIQQLPSFRPSLSKKSIQQMANCVYNVATRNQLWLQQKNQKLKRIKEQQEIQRSRRQSCTYSPALCPYKGNNDPSFSRFGKQGIANHFQRLSVVNKNTTKSKRQEHFPNKQNKQSMLNEPKTNYISKGKKPNYQQAVKQLHNRIMSLEI